VIYGLFIQDSPSAGEAFHSAARFIAAALARGHRVRQVFLYGEAVQAAMHPHPSGIKGLDRLVELARAHAIPVLACQAAMERLDIDSCRHPALSQGSLGQWFDAAHDLDRIVSFCS
jgi:sulfur relay (sulfurtransferase) complex TusBCD TusD component (DsrE family)